MPTGSRLVRQLLLLHMIRVTLRGTTKPPPNATKNVTGRKIGVVLLVSFFAWIRDWPRMHCNRKQTTGRSCRQQYLHGNLMLDIPTKIGLVNTGHLLFVRLINCFNLGHVPFWLVRSENYAGHVWNRDRLNEAELGKSKHVYLSGICRGPTVLNTKWNFICYWFFN